MPKHLLHLPLRRCRRRLHRGSNPRPGRPPGKNPDRKINLRRGKKSPLRLLADPFHGGHINGGNNDGKSEFRGVQVRGSKERDIDLLRRGSGNRRGEKSGCKCEEY